MKKITFIVEGVKGKQRPRASIINGHAVIYTPKDTKDYENRIAKSFLAVGGKKFDKDVPIAVFVNVYQAVPKTASKKKREELLTLGKRPMKKPDLDNCIKCLDGLNGVAWEDDSQIVEIHAKKFWAEEDFMMVAISDATQ